MAKPVEAACTAIGANGLLGRVGTYYHDIGKLERPQYFVENQPRGRNPHDKLKPSASAAIIRGHVEEGLELADRHRLPRSVRAFITEHHGTNRIVYFYEKARERSGGQTPTGAEYAYGGPLPRSPETAICMLADGVEAAARVLPDPTAERFRELVERIVRQRLDQGQLRDAPITLAQLERVKEQFVRVLLGMYHGRLDYPTTADPAAAAAVAAPAPDRPPPRRRPRPRADAGVSAPDDSSRRRAALGVAVHADGVRLPLGRDVVAEIARGVLRAERVRAAELSFTFVDAAAMAALNRRHLGHRGATDIITFEFAPVPGGARAGDVYVCPEVARENARRHGVPVREETARLVIHGTLHVLGHEHPEDEGPHAVADVAPAGATARPPLRAGRAWPARTRPSEAA
jgi:rRNA maturation RNase YbeY